MSKFLWTQRSDFGPGQRTSHAMTFDSQRGRTVLFGGNSGDAVLGDTWEWDGSFWTQMDNSGPGPRTEHAMVYDSVRQVSLLFGGRGPADPADPADSPDLGDTWQWDGQDWTQLADSGPTPRAQHGMAFDSARNRTVLFGGLARNQPDLVDTWEFDGQEWTQQADTGPPAAKHHPMAFDSAGARVLLFDGRSVTTWSWNGASWVQIGAFGPSSRDAAAMTAAAGSIVLFGGRGFREVGDSWRFDGTHWTQVQDIGPGPRSSHALTFDSTRGAIVLFGGLNGNGTLGDTWEHNT